jgi:membrane protein
LVDFFWIPKAVYNDIAACVAQGLCDAKADTAGGTGDDCRASLEHGGKFLSCDAVEMAWPAFSRASPSHNIVSADDVGETIGGHIERAPGQSIRSPYKSMASALSLGGLSLWQLTSRVWSSANDDNIVNRAAELAFYFLFALFPALIFLSAMFGLFASTRTKADIELMLYLGRVIPPAAFEMVETAFTATTRTMDAGNLVFGAITALWAATYGMSATQDVLNSVYRVKESRPFWKSKSIAVGLTLAIFVLVFCAMLLLTLGDTLTKLLVNNWLFNPSVLIAWKIVQFVAALFFMSLVFSLTYHWGPDRKGNRWKWISPGSIVGICGWLGVSIVFRIYLHFFNRYAVLYGSVGTVIILLTWFYISGLMLLLGAEINATVERAVAKANRILS